ncbi:hypothetical protein BD769DRAFT_1672580 [Suillus cothurnatus]|nr:hypothetical protein BD769DRAFT_1672580 [Suillus cothurnatus]
MSAPEPLSGTPDHSSCLGLCLLQYTHPMPSPRIDTRTYPTSYQVDGTPSEFLILVRKFPALIRTVPALIRKSFGRSTRVVCLRSPLDFRGGGTLHSSPYFIILITLSIFNPKYASVTHLYHNPTPPISKFPLVPPFYLLTFLRLPPCHRDASLTSIPTPKAFPDSTPQSPSSYHSATHRSPSRSSSHSSVRATSQDIKDLFLDAATDERSILNAREQQPQSPRAALATHPESKNIPVGPLDRPGKLMTYQTYKTLPARLRSLLYKPQTTKTLDQDDEVQCTLRNLSSSLHSNPNTDPNADGEGDADLDAELREAATDHRSAFSTGMEEEAVLLFLVSSRSLVILTLSDPVESLSIICLSFIANHPIGLL